MPRDEAEFKELARVKISEKTDAIISSVWVDGKCTGYNVNDFIRTPKYTGPTHGVFVPMHKVSEFKGMIIDHMIAVDMPKA